MCWGKSEFIAYMCAKSFQLCSTLRPCGLLCQAPLFKGFPGKDTGVGCHFLLQGIFPPQGRNPHL